MNGNAAEEYGLLKPRFQEFDNMFRVELFRVNPITDQANQATNQALKHNHNILTFNRIFWHRISSFLTTVFDFLDSTSPRLNKTSSEKRIGDQRIIRS